MAPIPPCRFNVAPHFEDSNIGPHGPIQVKFSRHAEIVWTHLSSCFHIRDAHLEVVKDLEADIFLDALHRFHVSHPYLKCFVSDEGNEDVCIRDHPSGFHIKFVSSLTPHQGSNWERLVFVSVYFASSVVSRPPTRSLSDPRDFRLTLAHFLSPSPASIILLDIPPAAPLACSELRYSEETHPLIASFQKLWIPHRRHIKRGGLVFMDQAQARDQLASRGSYGLWPCLSHSSHSVKSVFCVASGSCDGSMEEFVDGGGDD